MNAQNLARIEVFQRQPSHISCTVLARLKSQVGKLQRCLSMPDMLVLIIVGIGCLIQDPTD